MEKAIKVSKELHKRLKVLCKKTGMKISRLSEKLIIEGLESRRKKDDQE